MPRNPQIQARKKLEQAVITDRRSEDARKAAKTNLQKAMIAAVESGMTRYEVGAVVGVTGQRVARVPGMPVGAPGVRKKTAD
jgi:hypothetical protein